MLLSAPSRRRTRLGAIPLLFLTIVGLLVGGLSAPAQAANEFIAGTVTRQDTVRTVPLQGIRVELVDAAGAAVTPAASGQTFTTTGADGTYRLNVGAAGTSYRVKFSDPSGTPVYETEFYNGKAAAPGDTITVPADGSATGINGTLVKATPEISGLVQTSGGAPVSGVRVSLHERSAVGGGTGVPEYDPPLDATDANTPLKTTTGADGRFALDGEVGKNYVVQYSSPAFQTVYYNGGGAGTTNPATAQTITLTKGAGRSADVTVAANSGVTFTGTVTDSASPAANLQDVQVRALYPATQSNGSVVWTQAASTATAANGTYTLVAPTVAGREYIVSYSYPDYLTVYQDGDATGAKVTGSATRFNGANAVQRPLPTLVLSRTTSVTGKVTDAQGLPLSGVSVSGIRLQNGTWVAESNVAATTTGADGVFVLDVTPLANGVRTFRIQASKDGRVTTYFPNAYEEDEGTDVNVAANQVLTGRDLTMPTPSVLGGSITQADGTAFTGEGIVGLWRFVRFTRAGGAQGSEWREFGRDSSLESGAFSIQVPPGSYRLKVALSGSNQEGFLPGLVGIDSAPSITLGTEQVLSLQKYALPATRQIRGKVTNLAGVGVREPVSAAYRYVENIRDGAPVLSPWLSGPSVTPAADGSYAFDLPERTYRVGALNGNGVSNDDLGWWTVDGQTTRDVNQADDVVLRGTDIADLDFRLVTGPPRFVQRPYVTGIAAEGERLSANPGTWSTDDLTFEYRWQFSPNGVNQWDYIENDPTGSSSVVSGSNGRQIDIDSRCVLLPIGCNANYRGYAYRVVVIPIRGTERFDSVLSVEDRASKATSVAVSPAVPGTPATTTTENRQDPSISGKAVVGETLTGTDGVWSEGGTFSYQWLADGQVISGATTKTLVLGSELLGREITFRVTETGSDPDIPAVSAATAKVAKGALKNQAKPTITGSPQVGKTLTADPGTWNDPAPTFAYQWLANGQAITGATTNKLVLTQSELGRAISVQVTATKGAAYSAGVAVSDSTAAVGEDPTKVTNKTAPVVSGTAKVGEVLTTTDGTWTNDPTTFTYQWAADGTPIAGATAKTLTLAAAQAGKKVTVTVTAAKTGLTSGTATSAPTAAVAPADPTTCTIMVTGGPTVTGTAAVGQLLTAQPGTATPDGVTPSYQWLRDAQAIAGATASTYRVVAADQGSALAVQVTYRKTDCADVVRTAQAGTVPEQPQEPVKPSLSTVKKIKGTKLVLKVNVTATTQDPVAGVVEVTEGGKTLATKTLVDGKRKFVIRGFKRGFHSVQITFQGNSLVKERTKTITFTIR